jgi:hypothetical protein
MPHGRYQYCARGIHGTADKGVRIHDDGGRAMDSSKSRPSSHTHILDTLAAAGSYARFPVDVKELAARLRAAVSMV